jgi:hypothetical protein
MQCKVEGCCKEVRYKAAQLCQMHYFRQRRNGTTELVRPKARPRYEDERGYQFIYAPDHPLVAKGQFYVAEHRAVLFASIGPGLMCCALCGVSLTWATCDVDHIDEDPRNNARSNLRPTCLRCNTWRSMPPAHMRVRNAIAITYDGETKTPHEWSKDPRVSVSGSQIRHRKKAGMSDEQALFAPKRTHNGKTCPRDIRQKLKQLKERE